MLLADSHLDLGYSAMRFNRDLRRPVAEIRRREVEAGSTLKGAGRNTVSLPVMSEANIALCFATVCSRITLPGNNRPEGWRSPEQAFAAGMAHASYYRVLEAEGWLRRIDDAAALDAHLAEWEAWAAAPDALQPPMGYVLSIEGADPIVGPWQVEWWREQGLRIASLVHYGFNLYSYGTGTDGGLLPAGRDLLRELERAGILLDVTHLAEPAFWEAVDAYDGPLLATHNNCRALVPGDRQFSDDQLRCLFERGAVIGVAMDDWMLRPGWKEEPGSNELVSMEDVANQIDHICQLAGNSLHAAIGSDLDGGYGTEQTPRDLDTIVDLHKIAGILAARGYASGDVEAVMYRNWFRFLRDAWS